MKTSHSTIVTLTSEIRKRAIKCDMRCKTGMKLSEDDHLYVYAEIGNMTVSSHCISSNDEMSSSIRVADGIIGDLRKYGIDYQRDVAVAFVTAEYRAFVAKYPATI